MSGHLVTGSINAKTGLLKMIIGTGSDKVTGDGAVLLNPPNGGGYFLTTTNAQDMELTP